MGAAERYEARATLSLDRRAHTIARPLGAGSLRAAGARVDLTPALGVDTAGFGFIGSQHSRGLYGRLWATVLLIEGADGGRVLLVATDLLAGSRFISEHLGRELGPDLGLGVDRIWMGASHTHSGPGHYFGDRFYDCLAARTNDFDADTARFFVRQIAHAARRASEMLVPARLGTGSQTMWGSVWNRSFLPFAANFLAAGSATDDALLAMAREQAEAINGEAPPNGLTAGHLAVDARVQVLWVEAVKDRRPLGCFAICHGTPTVLPAHMALLSSDVTGVATRHVHRCLHRLAGRGVPFGVFTGSMGDTNIVDPHVDIDRFRSLRVERANDPRREDMIALADRLGRRWAAGVLRAADRARDQAEHAATDVNVQVRYHEAVIPGASGPGFSLPAEHQVGNAQFAGSELNRSPKPTDKLSLWAMLSWRTWPGLVGMALVGESSAQRRSRWWLPVSLSVRRSDPHSPKNHLAYDMLKRYGRRFFGRNSRAGDSFTPYLPVRHVSIGDLQLVGLPVEPSTWLAHTIRLAVQPDAPGDLLLIGLCGGYAGYAVTPEEYAVQDYEGGATVWGREFGSFLRHRAVQVAKMPSSPPGQGPDGVAYFDTDVRQAGVPVQLEAPRAWWEGFAGVAEVTIGPMEPSIYALDLPELTSEGRGSSTLHDLACDMVAERVFVLWGRWFSDAPEPGERVRPIADAPLIVLERQTEEGWLVVRWSRCPVSDEEAGFYLRRGISADGTRVRWTWSVRLPRDLLPDGTVVRVSPADRCGLRPIEGSVLRTWTWMAQPDVVQAAD